MAEMHAAILGLLCLVLKTAAGTNVCKFDGVFYDGSCYSFVNETATWFEALAVCTASGGNLAQVESQGERDWLKKELKARNFGRTWLGGTTIFNKKIWRWISNGDAIGPFTDWRTGQPSGSYEGIEERCLEMRQEFGFLWNDTGCTWKLASVCEMKFFHQ